MIKSPIAHHFSRQHKMCHIICCAKKNYLSLSELHAYFTNRPVLLIWCFYSHIPAGSTLKFWNPVINWNFFLNILNAKLSPFCKIIFKWKAENAEKSEWAEKESLSMLIFREKRTERAFVNFSSDFFIG